tara:strand:+ start:2609 stop:3037 length:429 start_codon:yes stop_codon:yes gene_type:complete
LTLAKLTLISEVSGGRVLIKGYGHEPDKLLKTGETLECLTKRAIQFIGCKDFKVSFSDKELDSIEDKQLENLLELGQFSGVDELRKHYSVKKSKVSNVISKATEIVKPTIKETKDETKDETKVEESLEENTSDEANLADDSE